MLLSRIARPAFGGFGAPPHFIHARFQGARGIRTPHPGGVAATPPLTQDPMAGDTACGIPNECRTPRLTVGRDG